MGFHPFVQIKFASAELFTFFLFLAALVITFVGVEKITFVPVFHSSCYL